MFQFTKDNFKLISSNCSKYISKKGRKNHKSAFNCVKNRYFLWLCRLQFIWFHWDMKYRQKYANSWQFLMNRKLVISLSFRLLDISCYFQSTPLFNNSTTMCNLFIANTDKLNNNEFTHFAEQCSFGFFICNYNFHTK